MKGLIISVRFTNGLKYNLPVKSKFCKVIMRGIFVTFFYSILTRLWCRIPTLMSIYTLIKLCSWMKKLTPTWGHPLPSLYHACPAVILAWSHLNLVLSYQPHAISGAAREVSLDLISVHKPIHSPPLHVFWCVCFVHQFFVDKLSPRTVRCVFLGYFPYKGYKCLDLLTGKSHMSMDVTFFKRSHTFLHCLFLPPLLFYLSFLQILFHLALLHLALPSLLWCINAGNSSLYLQEMQLPHLPLVQIHPPLLSLNFPLLFGKISAVVPFIPLIILCPITLFLLPITVFLQLLTTLRIPSRLTLPFEISPGKQPWMRY